MERLPQSDLDVRLIFEEASGCAELNGARTYSFVGCLVKPQTRTARLENSTLGFCKELNRSHYTACACYVAICQPSSIQYIPADRCPFSQPHGHGTCVTTTPSHRNASPILQRRYLIIQLQVPATHSKYDLKSQIPRRDFRCKARSTQQLRPLA
jgi:hypothetical protein